jgi:hypothetical protein
MMASRAMRGSSCSTMRCPAFGLATDSPPRHHPIRGRMLGRKDTYTLANPDPIHRRFCSDPCRRSPIQHADLRALHTRMPM